MSVQQGRCLERRAQPWAAFPGQSTEGIKPGEKGQKQHGRSLRTSTNPAGPVAEIRNDFAYVTSAMLGPHPWMISEGQTPPLLQTYSGVTQESPASPISSNSASLTQFKASLSPTGLESLSTYLTLLYLFFWPSSVSSLAKTGKGQNLPS